MRAEPALPWVRVNESMIVQVLINLMINANRHTKNGTTGMSAFATENNQICFSVEDNGDGFSSDLLPRVFERHLNGDGGSGLGLAICKDTIEAHGGRIQAENLHDGGARITFTLPYQNAKEEEHSEPYHPVD